MLCVPSVKYSKQQVTRSWDLYEFPRPTSYHPSLVFEFLHQANRITDGANAVSIVIRDLKIKLIFKI